MDWAGSLVRQYSSLQSRNSYYQQQQLQQLHQRPLEEEEEEEEEEESSDEEVHKLHIENELLKAELEAYQRENEELKAGSGAAVTKSNKKCAPRKRKRAAVAAIESDEESGTNSDTENDQENDDDDEHSSPSPPGRKKKPSSTFGANQSPITTPFGLIDGRSNSQASFEEKIHLLQEFKDEFNHLRVPEKPSNPRYRRLAKFLDKQRQHYRKYVAGDTSVPIWPERVEMLDNLGVWLLLPGEQRWEESYPKLVEFHKTYGHCCVSAIRSICQDQPEFVQWVRSIRSSFRGYEYKQQKLQKSLNEQRAADEQQQRQLQKEKEQDDENAEGETTTTEETASEVNQEKTDNSTNNNSSDANNSASGINGDTAAATATAVTTAPNNVAGTVAVAAATTASPKDIAALIANRTQLTQAEIKAAAYAYATGSINARPENQTGAISRTTLTVRESAIKRREEKAAAKQAAKEAAEEAERAKKEAFRNENIKIPQWYTDERHEMLKRFNCAWLSGFEFTAAANNTKGIGTLARTCWYANIERLKAFQKDHPDDFILIWGTPKEERTRLQKWILKQRKIYKHVMVTKTIPVNPVLEDQFKLLQEDYNIILHPDMVQAKEDEDRIKRETDIIKAEEDVKWKASAQYKLETALQTQSDAKAQVAVAKFQLEEAEKFLRKVQREFASARTEVKEAQEIVDADPVGKMVTVKPRGGNRGSGLARILAITKSTVLGSDLLFYDLEFVPTEENGGEAKKELFVDGVFVTPIVTPGTAPAVAPAFVVEVPPPRKAPRVMTTRGRAKKSPKELLEVTI